MPCRHMLPRRHAIAATVPPMRVMLIYYFDIICADVAAFFFCYAADAMLRLLFAMPAIYYADIDVDAVCCHRYAAAAATLDAVAPAALICCADAASSR